MLTSQPIKVLSICGALRTQIKAHEIPSVLANIVLVTKFSLKYLSGHLYFVVFSEIKFVAYKYAIM